MEAFSIMRRAVSPSATHAVTSTNSIYNTDLTALSPQGLMIIFAGLLMIVTLGVFMICFFKLRRDKRKASKKKSSAQASRIFSPSLPDPLHFQHKPELDAEQTRHEVEAHRSMLEMEGGVLDRYQEMSGDATGLGIPSLARLHELRGEEHARELDSSQ